MGLAENAERLAELQQLREDSAAMLRDLTREGLGQIDLGMARLEVFINAVMPWEDGANEDRLDFELAWERQVSDVLVKLRSDLVRAKLTQGISLAPMGPTENGHR